MLCVYCGIFLYIGASDLLPEAHAQGSWTRVALTAIGFVAIFAVTRLAGRLSSLKLSKRASFE